MGGFSSSVQDSGLNNNPTPQAGGGKMGGPIASAAQMVKDHPDQPAQPQQPSGGKGMSGSAPAPMASQDNQPMGKGPSGVNSFPQPNQQQSQPMGKGGYSNSATSGQPRMGQQNQYSNTVGQWDNTQIQPTHQSGKGKGG